MSKLQKVEQLKKAIYKLQESQELIIAALTEEDDAAVMMCEDIDNMIQDLEFTIDEIQT